MKKRIYRVDQINLFIAGDVDLVCHGVGPGGNNLWDQIEVRSDGWDETNVKNGWSG